MVQRATQGHLYRYGRGMRVLAMESGERDVRVRVLDPNEPSGMGRACTVQPRFLEALPMKYFKGEIPE